MGWSSKFSATHIPFVTLMYRKPWIPNLHNLWWYWY